MATWIIEIITEFGYLGIFCLMLLESVFPPIPSELIIPFAGFAVHNGDLDLWLVMLASTVGAVVGMLPWFIAGRLFGLERFSVLADRYGRWLTINADEVAVAAYWFNRFGRAIVFVGRLIPLIRTLISVPAGLSTMPIWQFILYSSLGAALFNSVMIGAGFFLAEHYHLVEIWLDPATTIIFGLALLLYVFRLITWRPGRTRRPE